MPVTLHSGAPRAQCARVETGFLLLPGAGQDQGGGQEPRRRRRAGPDGDLRRGRRGEAARERPREQADIFDSYDMSPLLIGTGKCERNSWFYFTEN